MARVLLSLVLTATVLASPPLPVHLPVQREPSVVSVYRDSTERADTTQLPLTVDVMHRLATFWTAFLALPDSIRVDGQRAHQMPLRVTIGKSHWADYRDLQLPPVVNMIALARRYPQVAAALRQVQLTAPLWEQYRRSLFTAQLTGQQAFWEEPDSVTSEALLWQNVAFLRTHLHEFGDLQMTGMWFPKIRPKYPPQVEFTKNQMSPDTLRLSDAHPNAPVTLTNPSEAPVEVWLALDCGAGRDSVEQLDLLASAWHNRLACAWPWLGDFSQHLTLAPHEHRTFSIAVHPPLTLSDGEYPARLTWAAHVVTQGSATIVHNEIAIVYTKGPRSPRPARTHWRETDQRRSRRAEPPLVQVTPVTAVLDTQSRTATITFTNPGKAPLELWLAMDCPWFHLRWTRVNVAGLVETQYEEAWHGRTPNVALWLSGYPQHVVLAPHERRTITLEVGPVEVFDNPTSSYYARLLYVQAPVLTVTPRGDTTYVTPSGAVNVVYEKGAHPQPLTLSPLSRVPAPNGRSQVCTTVQQPGFGVVVNMHAEVSAIGGGHGDGSGLAGAGGAPVWSVDTTVAVWEVHHDPFNPDVSFQPMPPAPVCFFVPAVAPKRAQLVVTATALEDTAQQRTVRTTLPWNTP